MSDEDCIFVYQGNECTNDFLCMCFQFFVFFVMVQSTATFELTSADSTD